MLRMCIAWCWMIWWHNNCTFCSCTNVWLHVVGEIMWNLCIYGISLPFSFLFTCFALWKFQENIQVLEWELQREKFGLLQAQRSFITNWNYLKVCYLTHCSAENYTWKHDNSALLWFELADFVLWVHLCIHRLIM